jgi:large subunit ribosomal protein L3
LIITMVRGIIGRKIGMTQLFKEGEGMAVTAIEAGPCFITQIKTETNDGYNAVQLGFCLTKRLNKAEKGHLKDIGQLQHLREFAVEDITSVQMGQKISVDMFKAGDLVNVIGISKGKGFAGGVKRHHFRGGPKTHGQSDRHRAPGSVGAGTSPGRVWKGQRMAGQMGNIRSTVRNLKVVEVDIERNVLLVQGAVPGANKRLLLINKAS